MEDEEEVDIIGNYDGFMTKSERDISKISSGQLLSCDYTVHPKWLNENAEGGNFWSESVPKNENIESKVEVLHSEEVVIEEPEPVSAIIASEWSADGEVASQDDLIFDDDIPALIEEIVAHQQGDDEKQDTLTESDKYCRESENSGSNVFEWEPAAFETHPPAKNAKYIGPTNARSLLKVKIESNPPQRASPRHPRSLLKITNHSNNLEWRMPSKFKKTLTLNQNMLKIHTNAAKPTILNREKPNSKTVNIPKSENHSVTKFKQTVKFTQHDLENEKIKIFTKKLKRARTSRCGISGNISVQGKGKKNKNSKSFYGENITISHDAEHRNIDNNLHTNSAVKVNGCSSDTDVEVDIETDFSPENSLELIHFKNLSAPPAINKLKIVDSDKLVPIGKKRQFENNKIKSLSSTQKLSSELSKMLIDQLRTIEIPSKELQINSHEISDLEKFIHSEFFENRTTKTPEQYLRIRNHILEMWLQSKPNYVSKTAVRSGLKNGGDVNCISRIHRLLEQIGAINFGCVSKYFDYLRPLENYIDMFVQTPRNRTNSMSFNSPALLVSMNLERSQRIRTLNLYHKENLDNDSNYTITHIDGVVRPQPPALNSVKNQKSRSYNKHIKSELDLVKCLKFSKENTAPFKVSVTLSTLLCMQLHSLSSSFEIMGFLGGHHSKSIGRNKLNLTRYKPCRTSLQSGTMCEMCPVSQVEQSSSLLAEGYELLGWFHSHPLFPAYPSRTDVRTQREMQNQFSFESNQPFVGVIFSCLNMAFKCVYIMPKDLDSDFHDNGLIYEIDVDIIKDCTHFQRDVQDALSIIDENCDSKVKLIEQLKICSHSILKQLGYETDSFFDGIFSKYD